MHGVGVCTECAWGGGVHKVVVCTGWWCERGGGVWGGGVHGVVVCTGGGVYGVCMGWWCPRDGGVHATVVLCTGWSAQEPLPWRGLQVGGGQVRSGTKRSLGTAGGWRELQSAERRDTTRFRKEVGSFAHVGREVVGTALLEACGETSRLAEDLASCGGRTVGFIACF